ncbi:MAG: metal-dependent hydrolase [Gemmataceae bacterium]|nr:metal-dependent hydrolase [Gemmataceae bacterium]
MASYQGHLSVSAVLGACYGAAGAWYGHLDWGPVFLAAGLTTIGGLLPDLDSDSGVPVRELFSLAAAITPFLLFERIRSAGFNLEQTIVLLAGVYLLVRYGVSELFKRFTVHRGMFHSLPAMGIAGLTVFLLYHNPNRDLRVYLAAGVALGFASHLVLDELCSVDFMGVRVKLKQSAGSALKLTSRSWPATATAYMVLAGLAYATWVDWHQGQHVQQVRPQFNGASR